MQEDDQRRRFFERKSVQELEDALALLIRQHEISVKRARIASSDVTKVLIEELRTRVEYIKAEYVSIDVTQYPNVVVARLATIQAQEREARKTLEMWAHAKETHLGVDRELKLCEAVLAEKREAASAGLRKP